MTLSVRQRQSGFTLVEVLVASFILFATLAAFTMILQTSLISSERAQQVVKESTSATLLVDRIHQTLHNDATSSQLQGKLSLQEVEYSWSARVKQRTRPPARYFGQQKVQAEHEMILWEVTIRVEGGSIYTYEEVSW